MLIEALAARDSTSCSVGTVFYSCVANKFRGCCSTDPCSLPSCPDKMGSMKDPKSEDDGDLTASASKDTDNKREETATSTAASSKATKETTTMTDSGITHTIPNNSVVTVTRHTTITTRRPTPTTSSDDDFASSTDASVTETFPPISEATSTPPFSDIGIGGDISNGTAIGALSSGAIVGIAVGGAMLIAIFVVLILAFIRRHKKRQSNNESAFNSGNGRDDLVEEKHFPHPVSAHTTGTQGSSDPFAPFGGRADLPEDPYRPPSGTFEMDGSSTAPVELPATSTPGPSTSARKAPRLEPVQEIIPTDPRANLNSPTTDGGKPAHVNHWDQYKNLG